MAYFDEGFTHGHVEEFKKGDTLDDCVFIEHNVDHWSCEVFAVYDTPDGRKCVMDHPKYMVGDTVLAGGMECSILGSDIIDLDEETGLPIYAYEVTPSSGCAHGFRRTFEEKDIDKTIGSKED